MSRGPLLVHNQKQNSVSLPFPIPNHPLSPSTATTYAPSFFPARYLPRSIGPVTACTAYFSIHAEVNLALRTPKLALPSVTVSPTYTASSTNPGPTFPPTESSPLDLLVPRSGVSTIFSRLSSVAPDPAATSSTSSSDSFSSSKSFEVSIPGTSTTSHGLSPPTTTTGGDSTSQSSVPSTSPSSTPFNFTTSLFTSLSVLPVPLSLSSTIMPTGNPSTTSSTPGHSSSPSPISTPLIPVPITTLNISTSVSTSSTLVSSTSTTPDPLHSSSYSMTTTTLSQSTGFDPSPSLSSFTTLSTTDSDPGSDVGTSTMDVIPDTPTNSLQHASTITATRVFTSTLPGGQTTVVSTVVESRVLSTSDPVIGSRFSHSTGAIIGVAVSATVGLILSVLVVFLSCARYRSREEQKRRRRQRGNWSTSGGKFGRQDLPPIPSGPIPTSGRRSRRDRMDSSANILSMRTPDIEYEEDKVWRPPLADDDENDEGVALGELVRGASPTGPGYAYGYSIGDVRHDDATGVGGSGSPTPPDSGEDGKGKSSHGHSQSPGPTSNGHGYGHRRMHVHIHAPGDRGVGVESSLLAGPVLPPPVVDSGIVVPPQPPHPVYGYLPVVGYPGPTYGLGAAGVGNGPGEVPLKAAGFGSYVGNGHEREVHPAAGRDVEVTLVSSENGRESRRTQRDSVPSGETMKGAGGLVTPRTSLGEDLNRSSGDAMHNVSEMGRTTPEHGLERGTGSRSSRDTTSKVESSSTSRSLKEVLNRFRTLVPSIQVTPDARPGRRNSKDVPSFLGSGGSVLAGTVPGSVNGGLVTRPGYDYGAIVRPHQRQMVLERALGHCQHMDAAGNGLAPPAPAVLVNHAAGMHFPIVDAYPLPELVVTSHPSATAGLLPFQAVTGAPLGPSHPYGRSVEEIDNEDDSLYARNSVVRDKLLDPYFLSPGGGSSPNIEGASLRDYVDYSRRIGGTVKNHLMSTTTFDTVDQDGASVTVGTLS